MVKYIIEKELAQGILNYLASRPYVEVAKFVDGMQSLQILTSVEELPVEDTATQPDGTPVVVTEPPIETPVEAPIEPNIETPIAAEIPTES